MIKFINTTEAEFLSKKLLYKYMPLEFALACVKERYLWLCNPVKWQDPFERKFIEARYKIGKKLIDFPIKGQVFCTCMTQTQTSEAHWNVYSREQIGISFKFKREKLLESLENHTTDYDIYIGSVKYLKTHEIRRKKLSDIEPIKAITPFSLSNRDIQTQLLLLKRIAFKYEDEIRILAIKKNKTKEQGIKLSYSIRPNELIDTITIDPRAGDQTVSMLKELFENKYGFDKVYKSQLYSMSNDVIEL
jgi:hypothetical protein